METKWSPRSLVVSLCALLLATACGGPEEGELPVDPRSEEIIALDSALGSVDMHHLMSDADISGYQTVSVDQVQSFLASKGSYLANYRDPAFGNRTAATLIVERARAFTINPVYILARIETESGLIRSGKSTNLAKATGCGCPDGSGCDAQYTGFGKQVECSAKVFRNYLRDLEAGRPTISGWKAGVSKNTLDPCTVRPANNATAALYTYTPWVGAYATQCGTSKWGGSSLVAALYREFRDSRQWGGPCTVGGDILVRYNQIGGAGGVLGACTTSELTTPDGVGRFNHFQNGSIYWTPETKAWEVHGLIRARWEALGWETGPLGYPTTGETATPDGVGRYNHFKKGSGLGSIYWTPDTGAWAVYGDIRAKWAALGWEKSDLGYPITNETLTPDGVGRFNHFKKGSILGSIYWTPATGAWEVHGRIRDKWAELGWEKSALGYPVSDEYAVTGGRESEFQKGFITFTASTGALSVRMK
ncbi:LGFP repeat-containing protein [Melittangium boletus]|uniref:LGFP repeat-containing protein n=1 Tax=Melittangium boletus TaxID=83453 RepID=UPI003DA20F26